MKDIIIVLNNGKRFFINNVENWYFADETKVMHIEKNDGSIYCIMQANIESITQLSENNLHKEYLPWQIDDVMI